MVKKRSKLAESLYRMVLIFLVTSSLSERSESIGFCSRKRKGEGDASVRVFNHTAT